MSRDFDYIIDISGLSRENGDRLWKEQGSMRSSLPTSADAIFVRPGGCSTHGTLAYAKREYPDVIPRVAVERIVIDVLPPTTIVHDGYTYTRGEKA